VGADQNRGVPAATAAPRPRRTPLRTAAQIATVVGTLVGIVALVFQLWPPFGGNAATGPTTSTATASTQLPVGRSGDTPPPAVVAEYLNTVEPKAGHADLGPLPDKLPATVDRRHAVTVRCPSNETGDQEHAVTYQLDGQYAALDTTVVAVFNGGRDYDSVGVAPVVGVLQRDGTIRTDTQNAKTGVTAKTPAPLHVDVSGAQEVTLQVTCSQPDGVVVLADARITRG
jgi:hypothetical protein